VYGCSVTYQVRLKLLKGVVVEHIAFEVIFSILVLIYQPHININQVDNHQIKQNSKGQLSY